MKSKVQCPKSKVRSTEKFQVGSFKFSVFSRIDNEDTNVFHEPSPHPDPLPRGGEGGVSAGEGAVLGCNA
jgi:hypothetical protein